MESNDKRRWNVYSIRRRPGQEKGYWLKMGVAFRNNDGSINLYLDAAPLDGKLQLREWKDESQTNGTAPDANGTMAAVEAEAF